MPRDKIFVSYSHADRSILDELLPMLQSVPKIAGKLWWDRQRIDIGDQFHPTIQQALEASSIGILLLSDRFLTSDYIRQYELPYLLQQAEDGALRLVLLYVSTLPRDALRITLESNGQSRIVDLQAYHGAHNPREPLNTLDRGQKAAIYAGVAERIASWLDPTPAAPPRQVGPRFELAVTLHARGRHWEHRFSLPQAPDFSRPELDCPPPEVVFGNPGHMTAEEDLFQLLFGSDSRKSGEILGAAFGGLPTADPTRYPLRVRLLTDDDRLSALPWATIAYQGRRLVNDGWTVELHAANHTGFPEYPPHTCYFPGKVVLIAAGDAAQTPQGTAHLHDVQRFFQQQWQQAPEPALVWSTTHLRRELRTGSPKLIYYYGEASHDGLLLGGPEPCFLWSELAELLQRSRSVSAVFLNLLGESSSSAISQGRKMLDGAVAVLLQCNASMHASPAARAATNWLDSVFVDSKRLDPVVALHQHQHGQIAAWTRYAHWRTIAPVRVSMSGLVNLLLDRRRQRAELSTAQQEFYRLRDRRIYQAVALGTAGSRVGEFPAMASQHLRDNKREQEVFLHKSFQIPPMLKTVQHLDDLVRQYLGIASRQSVLSALLGQEVVHGSDFWFPVLGWVLQQPLQDAEAGAGLVRVVADWCRSRLLQDLQAGTPAANIRVISVVAMETVSLEVAEDLATRISDLTEDLNREEGFHLGELEVLAGVRRQDLSNYFQDHQICTCDDRYRREFPQLLLGKRPEMPFDEAVSTIRRGEPDNWGNLFEELQALTTSGEWPPASHTPDFWEVRDGR